MANQFVLVEGFAALEAGQVYVNSEHFKTAMAWMPDVIAKKPDIIHVETPVEGWSEMTELAPTW